MKYLYLTEGKNDCTFLNIILKQNYLIKPSKIKLYFNEGFKDEKRMNESILIREFLGEFSPHDVLIKSERGKQNLISLLGKICIHQTQNDWELKLTTVFDHDGKDPTEEFDAIFTAVRRTHPQLTFELISDTPRKDVGHTASYSILKISGNRRVELNKIYFFCFFESLEKVIERKFGKDVPIDEGINNLSKYLEGIHFLPELNASR